MISTPSRTCWLPTRNASKSRVERSAQCASSIISATGCSSARRSSSVRICSNSLALARLASVAQSATPNSGRSLANSRDAWPGRSPATPSAPKSRTSSRSTAANGANGSPSTPKSRQAPTSTLTPAPAARAQNSPTSRDFPTPASPPIRTAAGSPARARSRAVANAARYSARPTRTGLLTRAPMVSSMPVTGNDWSCRTTGDSAVTVRSGRSHAYRSPVMYCRCPTGRWPQLILTPDKHRPRRHIPTPPGQIPTPTTQPAPGIADPPHRASAPDLLNAAC